MYMYIFIDFALVRVYTIDNQKNIDNQTTPDPGILRHAVCVSRDNGPEKLQGRAGENHTTLEEEF